MPRIVPRAAEWVAWTPPVCHPVPPLQFVTEVFLADFFDVSPNYICEILCWAQDGFDLKTVHKLSSKEKKIWAEPGFETRGCCVGSKNASSVSSCHYSLPWLSRCFSFIRNRTRRWRVKIVPCLPTLFYGWSSLLLSFLSHQQLPQRTDQKIGRVCFTFDDFVEALVARFMNEQCPGVAYLTRKHAIKPY